MIESAYKGRPLNFAHRGASHEAPENTLAAFARAAELGADGIELDVQMSKDGAIVVIHDLVLDKTTNGTGLVSARTCAELKELDAGGWFSPEFSRERIPTLQEVLDQVGHRLLLNVELKTMSFRDDGLAGAVVEALEQNDLVERTIVSSFNPLAVRRATRTNAAISIGLLYAPDLPYPLRRPWTRHWLRPRALHPHHSLVDASYLEWARDRGYRVHTWTVDEPEDMEHLVQAGVDIIITNRPDLLGRELGTRRGG